MSRKPPETRFLADRMLGTLTRYLRFMGYDTTSANGLEPGNPREDSLLLTLAEQEDRILLTGDAELARRGGPRAVFIRSGDVSDQIRHLRDLGLVEARLFLDRCSLCNTPLRPASPKEIAAADYAPGDPAGLFFFWCSRCGKLYWNGSHEKGLRTKLGVDEKRGC